MMTLDNEALTPSNHPALYYQDMLADDVRMACYRDAINVAVRPGDVVADLGTGLGVLALMAVRAGARRVYAIDRRDRVLCMADRIIRANGGEHRIQLLEGDVREIQLDQPVDIVINELIGDFGTDEDIYACVRHFARNNLKPGGKILPERLKTFLAPVEYAQEFRGIWRPDHYGLDLRAAMEFPCKPEPVMHALRRRPKELADAFVVEDIRFSADLGDRNRILSAEYAITRSGMLQGFVGYFDATLVEDIRITNYPCYPSCHWRNWHWPVTPPVAVQPGQRIELSLTTRIEASASNWKLDWRLE